MGSIKKGLKRSVWCSPALYFPVLRLLRSAGRLGLIPESFAPPESYRAKGLVNRETDLVMEGFPRSGNSFAVAAMELAQEKPLRIAHHFHVPAQIIYACRYSIPVLVILRDASDAVISQKIRTPGGCLDQGLRDWISFYRCLIPYRDRYVLAEFDDVIGGFGAVIDNLNSKFGTCFNRFTHTEENNGIIFSQIENWNARKHGAIEESVIARPSPARDVLKTELLCELETEKYSSLLRQAEDIYDSLISGGS